MPLPKLKDINWVTTDCYGTLIDWEKGLLDAFNAEADRDGFSFDEEPFINRFLEVQAEIMGGSYELYAEVLRRTAVKVAGEIGWELEPARAQFVPDSVARWLPFREANAAMDRLGKRAATSPTRRTSRRRRGGSAARRAGSTLPPALTPTSRRCRR